MKIRTIISFAYTIISVLSVESPFEDVTNSKYFLDKSNFIKDLFQLWDNHGFYIMITAPRGFAKSVNLDLVKRFIEITVNERGDAVSKKDTKNYRLFMRKNLNLEITKDSEFFDAHFGTYPVIYMNLSINQETNTFETIIDEFFNNVRKSFENYEWILNEEFGHLSTQERTTFNDTLLYKTESPEDVLKCVRILAKALNYHFNKAVVLLVDDHDSVLTRALEYGVDVHDVSNQITQPFRKTLIKLTQDVSRVLFTGVVNFAELFGLLAIRAFVSYEGQHDENLSKYFGFTIEQAKELFHRENITDKKRIENVINYYNGYYPPGGHKSSVLNPWSICEYLNQRDEKPQGYWARSNNVLDMIRYCSKNIFLRGMCGELFLNKTIELGLELNMGLSDLKDMAKYFNKANFNFQDVNFMNAELYFAFFYQLGLLTNDYAMNHYKITNKEVEEEFITYFIENNNTIIDESVGQNLS